MKFEFHRDKLFNDSYKYFKYSSLQLLKYTYDIEVKYVDEPGIDEGGVTKDWIECLS